MRQSAVWWIFISLVLALVVGAGPVRAQQVVIRVDADPPWTITADSVTAHQDSETYLAEGRVTIKRGDESIRGDRARYHASGNTAEIRGNVVAETPDFKVVCERLVVNLEFNIGKIYNGTVFFPQNHYYVSGDEIERTGPSTFLVIQGRATTCDGPTPAWTLTGRNITIQEDGYATAEHATFSTRHVPLLYTPWIKVPIKSRRQSGLLVPGITSSSRDGFTYSQPIYWAVSDSKDVTIYLNYMTKRGLETGLEFRFNDWGGKGTYRVNYLRDHQPPTIEYDEPFGSTVQGERYWIRGMSDFQTKSGFVIKFDLDHVSDPKYLDEFENGFIGFNVNKSQFLEEFGREFAEPLDPLRKTTFQVTRTINKMNLRFALEHTHNSMDPDNYETIQRLPRIGLDLTRQSIVGTPFYFSSGAEYTFFTRKTRSDSELKEEGHRLDIHPRLHWPTRLTRYLDLELSAGFRETLYYPYGMDADKSDPLAIGRNYRFFSRELYDFTLEASTSLQRVFAFSQGRVEKIKHRIKPEITFTYMSDRYQGDLPYWDSVDRIAAERSIRYGVVNYLVAKMRRPDSGRPGAEAAPGKRQAGNEPRYDYQEFLKVGLHRSYDFMEEGRSPEERSSELPPDRRRPHSPWMLEVELGLQPWFWAQAVSEYDTNESRFTEHAVELKAWDRRGDYFTLEYELHLEPERVTDRSLYEYEEVRGRLGVALSDKWSLQFEKRYSIMDNQDVETHYALNYNPQCWGMTLSYTDKPDDRAISIHFKLLGIGDIGGYTHQTESAPPTVDEEEEGD